MIKKPVWALSMLRSVSGLIALLVIQVLLAASALAHPHILMDAKLEIIVNEEGAVTAINNAWRFDAAFSAFAVQGLDKNNDNEFSPEELAPMARLNIDSLKEFGYFTFPVVSDRELDVEKPKDYWLEYTDGLLTLYFNLPIKNPVVAKDKKTVINLFDPTYYVAIKLVKGDSVIIESPIGCRKLLNKPDKEPEYIDDDVIADMGDETSDFARNYATSITIDCGNK